MAFNDTNYNAPLPLFDYADNFYPLLVPSTFGSNNSYMTVVIVVIAIFMLLFSVSLFSVILRCWQHQQYFLSGQTSRSRQRRFSFAPEDPLSLCNMGLDADVVEALPVFEYKAQSFNGALDCAVCLSEFEENQKARFLPNCKHSFHVDCIDMWFHSHSTCPICRTGVHPKQWASNNNADAISINVELISSSNREIGISGGLAQGETSSREAENAELTTVHQRN